MWQTSCLPTNFSGFSIPCIVTAHFTIQQHTEKHTLILQCARQIRTHKMRLLTTIARLLAISFTACKQKVVH